MTPARCVRSLSHENKDNHVDDHCAPTTVEMSRCLRREVASHVEYLRVAEN